MSAAERPFTIGFIVNPLAGIGGRVGLKGSDGAGVQREALARGAVPEAEAKAVGALRALAGAGGWLVTGSGPLGENSCRFAGLPCEVAAHGPWRGDGEDTLRLTQALLAFEPNLVLFAGGDGTARLVAQAAGADVPLLGIPAGVKMYSGVFARTPAEAGSVAKRFCTALPATRRLREAEILDLDEDARRGGIVAQRLFAVAHTPAATAVPAAKASHPVADEADVAALAAVLAG